MKIRLMGSETNLTSATAVGNATLVRVYNSTAGDLVMTHKTGSTVVGTMTVQSKTIELVKKLPAETLEGGAGLKVVSVATST
tara:strand:+ start:1291 stop:1536 length:246 start_codon:yes stop_codon:yes gene_type:complete